MRHIAFKEHETKDFLTLNLPGIALEDFNSCESARPEEWLGLYCKDFRNKMVCANYYIGLDWLEEGECAVSVLPKIPIDYIKMFMVCFQSGDQQIISKLSEIYHIDLERPAIDMQGISFEFTPLIIIHFLQLLQRLVKRGLKKDYVLREENLRGKVKGKLLFNVNLKKNVLSGRLENNYCRFQEYTVDCLENRILKKALGFVERFLKVYPHRELQECTNLVNQISPAFVSVGDIDNVQTLRRFVVNPFYKEYAQALKVAKLILKRFGYEIKGVNGDVDKLLPPFWIDMPLLFELYVLCAMRARYGKKVVYHIATVRDEIDYGKIDEQLIIDAKYIPSWADTVKTDNVGQLARYARTKKIRNLLLDEDDESTLCNCMIVYPDKAGITSFEEDDILSHKHGVVPIKGYTKFYKLGVCLPVKENL